MMKAAAQAGDLPQNPHEDGERSQRRIGQEEDAGIDQGIDHADDGEAHGLDQDAAILPEPGGAQGCALQNRGHRARLSRSQADADSDPGTHEPRDRPKQLRYRALFPLDNSGGWRVAGPW